MAREPPWRTAPAALEISARWSTLHAALIESCRLPGVPVPAAALAVVPTTAVPIVGATVEVDGFRRADVRIRRVVAVITAIKSDSRYASWGGYHGCPESKGAGYPSEESCLDGAAHEFP